MTEALDVEPQGWWQPTEQQQLAIDTRAKAIADQVVSEIDTTGLPTADFLARQLAQAATELAQQAIASAADKPSLNDGAPSPTSVWSSQKIEDALMQVRGANGQPRFANVGPPPTLVVGAEPGDTYLDVTTGDLYRLD